MAINISEDILTLLRFLINLLILLCEIPPCSLCLILTVPVSSKHSINRSGVLWPTECLQGRQPSIVLTQWEIRKRGSCAAQTCNFTLTHKSCLEVTFAITALATPDRTEAFVCYPKILVIIIILVTSKDRTKQNEHHMTKPFSCL